MTGINRTDAGKVPKCMAQAAMHDTTGVLASTSALQKAARQRPRGKDRGTALELRHAQKGWRRHQLAPMPTWREMPPARGHAPACLPADEAIWDCGLQAPGLVGAVRSPRTHTHDARLSCSIASLVVCSLRVEGRSTQQCIRTLAPRSRSHTMYTLKGWGLLNTWLSQDWAGTRQWARDRARYPAFKMREKGEAEAGPTAPDRFVAMLAANAAVDITGPP
mmetsp:Transcript_32075/g.95784  ORF Transcript_32075/g.95784 Transcript_32075/m.95784 type:complete len:220 (+) Transcript_32075:197-856(+)|eukprot:365467-Chlamydomonas_euryale.AAC.15